MQINTNDMRSLTTPELRDAANEILKTIGDRQSWEPQPVRGHSAQPQPDECSTGQVNVTSSSGDVQSQLNHIFNHHALDGQQLAHDDAIRTGAKHFAEILLKHTSPGDRVELLRMLQLVVMAANRSIALPGF